MQFLKVLKRSSLILLPCILFGIDNIGTYGQTYPIAEEHLLEKIKNSKIQPIPNTKELLIKTSVIDLGLPIAKKDSFRRNKPQFIVPEDFIVDGKLVAKKGQVINLLERVKGDRQYVALSDAMMADYAKYARDNRNVVFLLTKGNVMEMQERYPEFYIYACLPQVAKILDIKKIPSIIYQYENELIVIERKWDKKK